MSPVPTKQFWGLVRLGTEIPSARILVLLSGPYGKGTTDLYLTTSPDIGIAS